MGNAIEDILKQQGRSKRWLAQQIGIHETTLSKYLKGHRRMPEHLIRKVARVLALPESLLLSHAESVPTGDDNEPDGIYPADDESAIGDGANGN